MNSSYPLHYSLSHLCPRVTVSYEGDSQAMSPTAMSRSAALLPALTIIVSLTLSTGD